MSAPYDPHRKQGPFTQSQLGQTTFNMGLQGVPAGGVPQQQPSYGGQYQPAQGQMPLQQQHGGFASPPYGQQQPQQIYGQQPAQQAVAGFSAELFGQTLPSAQLGLTLGTQALSVGQDYMNRNLDRLVPKQRLKAYFNVTNSFVLQKILLILFPFRHKSWQRTIHNAAMDGQAQQETYSAPRDDINAPDLYIPAMALVTYMILKGVNAGIRSEFHPEVLGKTASSSVIWAIVELGIIKLGLYLFSLGADMSTLDIFSIIGYNYVGMITTVSAGILGGFYVKYAIFAYVSLAMCFFVLRSLRQNFLPESTEAMVVSQRRKRINALFAIAVLQVVVAFASV